MWMPKPSNHLKRPYIAELNEVIITRNGGYAVIDYRDLTVGGVNLKLDPDLNLKSDEEILHHHNQVLLARQLDILIREPVA